MVINEQIVTGRAHRVLIDKATKLWQRISYWTKGSDVEFNDAKTAETKVGAIDGITDSLVSTSSRIAASAKALSQLNNDLVSDIYVGDDGKLHKVQGGADTVLPFKQNNIVSLGSMPTSLDVKQFIIDNELPIDYSKLSNSNFLPVINSISAEGGRDWISGGASYSYVPRISYNSNTGILTTNGNAYFYRSSNGLILKVNAKCTLYLAY